MGETSGLCGVNEFHDEVSGICGHCSDICRDITKPDSFCLYHCPDYYSRLLSTTTVISLQEAKSVALPVTSFVLVVVIISLLILVIVTITFRRLYVHSCKFKRYEYPGRYNVGREFTASGFRRRYRVNHRRSVQETRDPNEQEDLQLSVLCMSPCSSLVLATESAKDVMRFKAFVHDQLYLKRDESRQKVTTDANVSAQDVSSYSDFEETQLKIACDIESRSPTLHSKVSTEPLKNPSTEGDTNTSQTCKIQSRLDDKDIRKHISYVEGSGFGVPHSVLHNGEDLHTPVQESYTLVSYKGVPS